MPACEKKKETEAHGFPSRPLDREEKKRSLQIREMGEKKACPVYVQGRRPASKKCELSGIKEERVYLPRAGNGKDRNRPSAKGGKKRE